MKRLWFVMYLRVSDGSSKIRESVMKICNTIDIDGNDVYAIRKSSEYNDLVQLSSDPDVIWDDERITFLWSDLTSILTTDQYIYFRTDDERNYIRSVLDFTDIQ